MTVETSSRPHVMRRRWTAPALAVLCSVCLNIGFASYIAVQALRTEPPEVHHAPGEMISRFAARLPSRDADILLQAYKVREPAILAAAAAERSARLQVKTALSHRALDTDVLRAALKDGIASHMHAVDLLADTVVDALARISPDGRRQLANQLHAE